MLRFVPRVGEKSIQALSLWKQLLHTSRICNPIQSSVENDNHNTSQ